MRQMILPIRGIFSNQGIIAADKNHIFRVFLLGCTRKIIRAGNDLRFGRSGIDHHDLVMRALVITIQPDRHTCARHAGNLATAHVFRLLTIRDELDLYAALVGLDQCLCDSSMREGVGLHQHLPTRSMDGIDDFLVSRMPRSKDNAHTGIDCRCGRDVASPSHGKQPRSD